MSNKPPKPPENDPLVTQTRLHRDRRERWLREGDQSIGRHLAQIGVLGWIYVAPTLLGLYFGRWLDEHFATGIFWSATFIVLGLCLGGWSAWKWMNAR
ncbi:AtpZ/AtpI family protein [Granulosicoccus antarcticus]|uniref:ATP synthase protein I n=1 Tax=Granulosicoccus antarcticus IMCC3135 TaxID=1192854 RepID=A0A2Z2NYC3_9GAMM|nr:AtpZ/AtpI family protein [Granulosicoccus antarcticus]ASJ74758.1 hypothetical protein IMCC3135_23445 [Granulosicoccus antarcticus IMCC3135]